MCDHKDSYAHGVALTNEKHEKENQYITTYYTIIGCTKCKQTLFSLPIPFEVYKDLQKYNALTITKNYPTV